jgi:hypothetical protein
MPLTRGIFTIPSSTCISCVHYEDPLSRDIQTPCLVGVFYMESNNYLYSKRLETLDYIKPSEHSYYRINVPIRLLDPFILQEWLYRYTSILIHSKPSSTPSAAVHPQCKLEIRNEDYSIFCDRNRMKICLHKNQMDIHVTWMLPL